MNAANGYPVSRRARIRRTIALMQQRMREQRGMLLAPRQELAAARQLARTHRRLEVMRQQLR
jgi:hypothetical protein